MAALYEVDPPARRGVIQSFVMMMVGAAGVAAALVTDFVAKGDASAILKMNVILNQVTPWNVPLGYLTLALLIAGPIAVMVFEPRTKRAAFYTGASVLAVAMAGTPIEELERVAPLFDFDAPSLQGTVNPVLPSLPETMLDPQTTPNDAAVRAIAPPQERALHQATFTPCGDGQLPVVRAGFSLYQASPPRCGNDGAVITANAGGSVPVTISVMLPGDGALPKMSARLHDAVSDQTWDLGVGRAKRRNDGYLVTYTANVTPGTASKGLVAHLYVRVEAEGYAIAEIDQQVSRFGPVVLGLQLDSTSQPLWVQRFSRPYKF